MEREETVKFKLEKDTKSLIIAKIINVVNASMLSSCFDAPQPVVRLVEQTEILDKDDYFLILKANYDLGELFEKPEDYKITYGRYKQDGIYLSNICSACDMYRFPQTNQILLYRVRAIKHSIFKILEELEDDNKVYFLVPQSRIGDISWITHTVGISNNNSEKTDGYTNMLGIYYHDKFSAKDIYNDDRLNIGMHTCSIIFDPNFKEIQAPNKNKFIKTFYGTFINGIGDEYTVTELATKYAPKNI